MSDSIKKSDIELSLGNDKVYINTRLNSQYVISYSPVVKLGELYRLPEKTHNELIKETKNITDKYNKKLQNLTLSYLELTEALANSLITDINNLKQEYINKQ
jgi:hypothetical protein